MYASAILSAGLWAILNDNDFFQYFGNLWGPVVFTQFSDTSEIGMKPFRQLQIYLANNSV